MNKQKQSVDFVPVVIALIILAVLEAVADVIAFPLDEILVPAEGGFDLLVVIVMVAMQYFGGGNMRRIK
ncbi:MAG: hypothetical protein J9259_09795 [Thermoplasmata archaeon YP2-bin.285]|uniref:Uncharacterized protein n=1 Tax=Candidatus Sysuiplasma superficiale TaxID=2823368 RepID=A0A8J7YV85_9ARCH|nr:hypothetical protein [Candidatus Sysuiplasma superficiale]